uniref:Uncharacterized protein n=1 Tax=Branchiostoma floridae TaxID=7739 RepID=C3ZIU8_BRAFL|eukprot:XP_002591538.1 hypothetical protein BRAFLDRAFT_92767 [Branchiostoma floridae]
MLSVILTSLMPSPIRATSSEEKSVALADRSTMADHTATPPARRYLRDPRSASQDSGTPARVILLVPSSRINCSCNVHVGTYPGERLSDAISTASCTVTSRRSVLV